MSIKSSIDTHRDTDTFVTENNIQAANGKESVLEFNLTQAQAKKLGQTENILLEVKASTTNNQEVVVAADAKLSFDLKLVAKAVITDLDDF